MKQFYFSLITVPTSAVLNPPAWGGVRSPSKTLCGKHQLSSYLGFSLKFHWFKPSPIWSDLGSEEPDLADGCGLLFDPSFLTLQGRKGFCLLLEHLSHPLLQNFGNLKL